jgi:hypothetical protein
MNLGVPLRLPHAIPREPRKTIARIWKFLGVQAHAAQAVEQLRPSEGWEQWLAARRLFTRTALPTSW